MLIEMTLSKQELTNQLGVRESSSELLEQLAALYQSEAGVLVYHRNQSSTHARMEGLVTSMRSDITFPKHFTASV